jgi:hypothetical protein
MKGSPIAPAANAFNCSRPIPVDLRVGSQSANSMALSEQGSRSAKLPLMGVRLIRAPFDQNSIRPSESYLLPPE